MNKDAILAAMMFGGSGSGGGAGADIYRHIVDVSTTVVTDANYNFTAHFTLDIYTNSSAPINKSFLCNYVDYINGGAIKTIKNIKGYSIAAASNVDYKLILFNEGIAYTLDKLYANFEGIVVKNDGTLVEYIGNRTLELSNVTDKVYPINHDYTQSI